MARSLDLLIPGDLATPTGGYAYARRILAGLAARGWRVEVRALAPSFPRPAPPDLAQAAGVLKGIPSGRSVLIDGLALGAMPEVIAPHASRLDLTALVHHPLALETGLTAAEARRLRDSERRALALVRRVVTTSQATADVLTRDYEVEPGRIRVAAPGTDPAPSRRGSGSGPIQLLCVGTLTPRKGHALLFEALARLTDLPWRLTCVGSATRDPAHARSLVEILARLDLTGRARLTGAVGESALAGHYETADALVLASYHEGYGMVLAEALARGLPVIATTAGAIPQTVPAEAGLLVPPGDLASLTGALRRFLVDGELRARLQAGAGRARASLPTWEQTCVALASAIESPPGVLG